jgi:hypothetical protein
MWRPATTDLEFEQHVERRSDAVRREPGYHMTLDWERAARIILRLKPQDQVYANLHQDFGSTRQLIWEGGKAVHDGYGLLSSCHAYPCLWIPELDLEILCWKLLEEGEAPFSAWSDRAIRILEGKAVSESITHL